MRDGDGPESYEVGCYDPQYWDEYVPAGGDLFRKERKQVNDWRGFNNFHRATHWMPLMPDPTADGPAEVAEQVRSAASHPNPPDTGRLREALETAPDTDLACFHVGKTTVAELRAALSASPSVGRPGED